MCSGHCAGCQEDRRYCLELESATDTSCQSHGVAATGPTDNVPREQSLNPCREMLAVFPEGGDM